MPRGDSVSVPSESRMEGSDVAPSSIAPLRKRVLAFLIDVTILGVIGFSLGLFLEEQLMRLGGWARLAGFGISVLYFGAANSRDFAGRTVGKAAFGIRVLSKDGSYLTVGKSLARAAVLCAPYFLNGAAPSGVSSNVWAQSIWSVLAFGCGVSLLYMFFFNRSSHQSIHDLIVGSLVVEGTGSPTPHVGPLPRRHASVVASLLLIAAVAPFVTSRMAGLQSVTSLMTLADSVGSGPGARVSGAQLGSTSQRFVSGVGGTQTRAVVNVQIADPEADIDGIADRIVDAVLNGLPELDRRDVIAVTFMYGYDLGIASRWRTQTVAYSPAEWRARLASTR